MFKSQSQNLGSNLQLNDKSPLHRNYSDDEEEEDEEEIEYEQIEYNRLILEAYQSFQQKDLQSCIKYYHSALEILRKSQDFERQALIKANLAVVLFHNCDYRKAATLLDESLETLQQSSTFYTKNTSSKSALLVKIYANQCIVNIVLNKYQESKDANEKAIQAIQDSNPSLKMDLIQELVYIYFRFTSFSQMQDGFFEGVESKYDGASVACFYSSMGLNRELFKDYQSAYTYHKKALDRWKEAQEPGFVLLSLRHLISITKELKLDFQETQSYMEQLTQTLKSPEFSGANYETLFKDFDKKINCASDITYAVSRLEEQVIQQDKAGTVNQASQLLGMSTNLNQSSNNLMVSKINNVSDTGHPLWKQAIKLRLLSSINFSQNILQNSNKLTQEQRTSLQMGAEQMKYTLQILQSQTHPLIQKQILSEEFSKQAVVSLKSSVAKISKLIKILLYRDVFNKITQQVDLYEQEIERQQEIEELNRSQMIIQQKQINKEIRKYGNPVMSTLHYKHIMAGDYLTKINKDSNGRPQKFFQVATENILRWSANEKNIKNPNKISYYGLSEIRGVIYGKCTQPLRKGYNKKLQNWLCFSLILKSRSLDFYCDTEQISSWVKGMSQAVKKMQDGAYVVRPGQFYWRKLKLILFSYLVEPLREANPDLRCSFATLIIAFKKNGFQLGYNQQLSQTMQTFLSEKSSLIKQRDRERQFGKMPQLQPQQSKNLMQSQISKNLQQSQFQPNQSSRLQ